jgi:DNA-binding Lrp family transcriptional regulator
MVNAYVLISASPGKALDVATQLSGTPGVVSADAITGEYDIIAKLQAEDIAGVGRMVVEKVQASDGVFKTITCLVVQ